MIRQEDLKLMRAKYNMTQRQVASMLNCCLRAYNYYESGARAFPKSLSELLYYKLREKGMINEESR